jgi:prolyl 4-hydroxylase
MSGAELLPCVVQGEPHAVAALSAVPRIYLATDFLSPSECEHVLARAAAAEIGARSPAGAKRDVTGFSHEMPVEGDPVTERIRCRIHDCIGFVNDFGHTLRFRRYRAGEYHPLHHDDYAICRSVLVATALIWLTDTPEGGETRFPAAAMPLEIRPRRGALLLWFNRTPEGAVDPAAIHEALPVRRGEKATITAFIYRSCRI